MELRRRGAKITQIECDRLVIKLAHDYTQERCDYEMGAMYLTWGGKKGVVYFANKGNEKACPFIELKNNREKPIVINEERENLLVVNNAGEIKKLWLVLWYHQLMELGPISVPFREDAFGLEVVLENNGGASELEPIRLYYSETDDFNDEGNMLIFSEIDLSDPEDIAIVNSSKPFYVKNYQQYRNIVIHSRFEKDLKELGLEVS